MTKLFIILISGFAFSANCFAESKPVTKKSSAAKPAPAPVATQTPAAAIDSEIFYQPAAGQSTLTAGLTYTNGSIKKTSSSNVKTTSKTTGYTPAVLYQYGVSETMAVGAALEYTSQEVKNSSTSGDSKNIKTGLGNLNLQLNGKNPLDEGRMLWFGATLSLSPGASTLKYKSADKTEENNYSGGNELTPYIGFTAPVNGYNLSAKLSHDLNIGDKTLKETDNSGVTTKYDASGGATTTLSLIGEKSLTSGLIGLELDYAAIATTDLSTTNGSGTLSGGNIGLLSAFGRCNLNETSVFLWRIGYSQVLSNRVSNFKIDSSSIIVAQFGARFTY